MKSFYLSRVITVDLSLHPGTIFARLVVPIGARRRVRSKFFQPHLIVVMKARLVVVDEYRSGDMHCVHQTKTFGHTAPVNELLNLRCDVEEPASIRHLEPNMFCERFH